jgi:hypothetical protein
MCIRDYALILLEASLLTHHLSHAPLPNAAADGAITVTTTSTVESTSTTLSPHLANLASSGRSTVTTRIMERDLGMTSRELLSNATQTGAEETLDNAPLDQVANTLAEHDGNLMQVVEALTNKA